MTKNVKFLLALFMSLSLSTVAVGCNKTPTTESSNTSSETVSGDSNTGDNSTGDDSTNDDSSSDDSASDDSSSSDSTGGDAGDGTVEIPDGEETENAKGPKATVATATADVLASFNNQGVMIYDLSNFKPTGETAMMETAYIFAVTETLEEAKAGEYANWIADYYVSVDTAVEAGKIGLAGSYDEWDNGAWVAFYSPIALEANQEIGLLESTGGTPWTYADVVEYVGTFRCGAFDLDNACAGITLKVELRLTNPEDATDIISICITEYVFA